MPGVLQAATTVSAPPEEISDIGSLAIMTAAARRTTPGVSPYRCAAAGLTVTSICGMNSSATGWTSTRPGILASTAASWLPSVPSSPRPGP